MPTFQNGSRTITMNEATRSARLKAQTRATHEKLDQRIMAESPFASKENYARFLQAQYGFLREVDALYDSAELAALLPDLKQRRRYASIAADLGDLGRDLPSSAQLDQAPLTRDADLATALGWMYVTEGSKLGGAILYKLAGNLGFDEHFGARHLAGHPDGRARHWREFTGVLDAVELDDAAEQRLVRGAEDAFNHMFGHVERAF